MIDNTWPETVVIWGAGATKHAGLLTTLDIASALTHILDNNKPEEIDFTKVFGNRHIASELKDGFEKLIIKFNEDNNIKQSYDLEALKLIAGTSSREFDVNKGEKINLDLQELFTLMDQLIENNLGLKIKDLGNSKEFLNVQRIANARNCLNVLIEELQRIAVQGTTPGIMSNVKFYHDLAGTLAKLMEEEAFEYEKKGFQKDSRQFYLYSYALISFNWDPLFLWAIFNAHKDRNDQPAYMEGCLPLRLFDDLGTYIATRKVERNSNQIWYSANETQCIRVNDDEYPSRIMRMGKLIYPHGFFGSRYCPQCGKVIASFGHKWEKDSSLPFGPSLIYKLQPEWEYNDEEKKLKEHGVIKCLFCGQDTRPYDMPLEMQTIIKKRAIAPLDEIKKEMGLLIKHARHVVFAGYSMPKDDISEKVFLLSFLSGQDIRNKQCSVILYDQEYASDVNWLIGKDILEYIRDERNKGSGTVETLKNILSIFELENTRLTLKGIPGIFNSYSDMKLAVIDTFYQGEFPPERDKK